MDAARLSRFDLLQKIGEGGMGVVYKARDTLLERVVAIKFLPERRAADAEGRTRFIHEAKAASALNHPNIVTIHEVGEQDGRTFMVMEFVDGKPLNELIRRKGMRLTEALRVAAQVADALTAAHAAGIVHRDLKPGNIMVDGHGRVKVLDFGLAKQTAPAPAADEETRTMPVTEEGAIVGSVPYMSPEQAEGRPVDARSDIFSFGVVLYEMVTGQRAFRGDSRISTLAAVVEKEPQPISETGAVVPPELERLITRCLRKDLNRRCQSIADVKLALEELRDDSESGKLARRTANAPPRQRWLWPALCAAVAMGAVTWAYLHHRGPVQPQTPDLVRLSPDDGHMYESPSISPDGKFVAYVSDRSGQKQVWLQQVGAGDPIQLTHTTNPVVEAAFFPAGTQILYTTVDASSNKSSIEVIPTLGGKARVLRTAVGVNVLAISPDGRQAAFTEYSSDGQHLMLLPLEGGPARELTAGSRIMKRDTEAYAWSPDNRWLISFGGSGSGAQDPNGWDWFALPAEGGANPIPTGAGDAMRTEGFSAALPMTMRNGRVVFLAVKDERFKLYDIRIAPGSWRVTGAPRQLTFGSENALVRNVSSDGTVAVEMGKESNDLYLVPLDAKSGQAKGITRRLTQDGRYKQVAFAAGEARDVYFWALDLSGSKATQSLYALDLESGQQTLLLSRLDDGAFAAVSRDGRQIAYSVPEGDSYSIRLVETGADPSAAGVVCKSCGVARRFSPDGRFLLYSPEKQPNLSNRKLTVRLIELASGKDRPWLEHPTESVWADSFSEGGGWLAISLFVQGSAHVSKHYLVPWREEPVPVAEWVEAPVSADRWEHSPSSKVLYFPRNSKMMGMRFDPNTRKFGEPFDTNAADWKPGDVWQIPGPGLVYTRQETHASVYLMKLPN